jgi:hypothetical protein
MGRGSKKSRREPLIVDHGTNSHANAQTIEIFGDGQTKHVYDVI